MGRSTGFCSYANETTSARAVFSEFAWRPLGWVLLFDGEVDGSIREVTRWADWDYNAQWTSDILVISSQWAEGSPLDFRSPEQVAATRAANEQFLSGLG